MSEQPNFAAGGDIYPCRFVTISGDFEVSQSVSLDYPTGISGEGLRKPNLPDSAETLHAKDGEEVVVHGDFEYCLLELGQDCDFSELLAPDDDGKGIPALNMYGEGRLRPCGAEAMQSGVAGEKIRVRVIRHRGDTID